MKNSPRNRRTKFIHFNPNHDFVSDAVEEYLKSGGQIKQILSEERNIEDSFFNIPDNIEADEFLQE
ncbi:hypothetical protein KKA14_03780 [bacterium]|nr:hypothetical protein [bacterium]